MKGVNYKLGNWLEDVKYFFEGDVDIQETLYQLQTEMEDFDLSEHECSLLNNTLSYMMKLSFIIRNNPEKMDKLVKHLMDC